MSERFEGPGGASRARRPSRGRGPIVWGDDYSLEDHTAPHKTARQVLDIHADLHRYLTTMSQADRSRWEEYGLADLMVSGGVKHEWASSHLHPATDLRDLSPWTNSLGGDLAHATTFQVTAEMIDLAEALLETTPNANDITQGDLPADAGFMWLDRPVARPSEEDQPGQQPLVMHAVSWVLVPQLQVQIGKDGPVAWVPAIRLREWGWDDSPDVAPRPLHMMGQSTVPLTEHVISPLRELHLVHMIWILMQMEIVATTQHPTDRGGRRRAAKIAQDRVRVVTLRRTRPASDRDSEPRHVDWSCTWLVREHHRHAHQQDHRAAGPHKGSGPCSVCGDATSFIAPYIKGPEGLPLRASDILYKLAR